MGCPHRAPPQPPKACRTSLPYSLLPVRVAVQQAPRADHLGVVHHLRRVRQPQTVNRLLQSTHANTSASFSGNAAECIAHA